MSKAQSALIEWFRQQSIQLYPRCGDWNGACVCWSIISEIEEGVISNAKEYLRILKEHKRISEEKFTELIVVANLI